MKESAKNGMWVSPPEKLKLGVPFLKARPLRPLSDDCVEYEASTDRGIIKVEISNNASFAMSNGQSYDDMCDMDILNEPEVLNNLVQRYKADCIFTLIGPTLIIVNPYRVLPQYFSQEQMLRIRNKIIDNTANKEKPHIYLIAGHAYNSMIDQQKKQAIVISGESGAGKTESTKYCMQLLTSLSHRQSHPIQAKILACNPVLEAFGNSKTLRNDNSSRFGKYVQIYFAEDNTIAGASMNSYLLQKSRVVSASLNQRSYHIFYCLLTDPSMKMGAPNTYKYLQRAQCFSAAGVDDKKYFEEIKKSMINIGFTNEQMSKIWVLLCAILELGNIQFDDKEHLENQSTPCKVLNKPLMEKIAKRIGLTEESLQKILLFQKKKFLKEFTFSPYNKNKCYGNINTLSKAIYNAIFQFIFHRIQISLKPTVDKNYNSISILDIFGFENFDNNSFQQFCINFTNEKLLKLYNQYVFERQMKILEEDGLANQIKSIKPPANDAIIEVISGKLSLFSIINDLTMPQQFKDSDIIQGFQNKLSKSEHLKFEKISQTKFTILHSQCNVKYEIEGFKEKNQDKVLPEILDIVNGLFHNENKEQVGRTLLSKFSIQIDQLMKELTSSSVHFIRCIKPNQKKKAQMADQLYMLSQVRYLGVFQTIQIRKKTFPSRWTYEEFISRFGPLFPGTVGSQRSKTQKIMRELSKKQNQYLLGNQRVYMNSQIQNKLSKKLHEMMKKKIDSAKKIWKSYKNYKFRRQVFVKLKILAKRVRLWKKIASKFAIEIEKKSFQVIKDFVKKKKDQEKQKMNKKLAEAQKKREIEQKNQKIKKKDEIKKQLPGIVVKMEKIIAISNYRMFFIKTKGLKKVQKPDQKKKSQKVAAQQMNKNYDSINTTMLNESIVEDTKEVYKRNIEKKEEKKDYQFNQSFLNEVSIIASERPDIVFEGLLYVPTFNPKSAKGLERLKLILSEKFKFQFDEAEEDFFSPPSNDAEFRLQETPNEIMNKVMCFDSKAFFKKVLRKRTNFIGMSKDEDDILIFKPKPLSKSLTLLSEEDELDAIKIFKALFKISEEPKLDNVFNHIESMINLCQKTSPQLKNQVLLQLIKQSNTEKQLTSVRILQTMTVFLHIYSPDNDFLFAALNFFYKKLSENHYTGKQDQYVRYNFKKIIRKIERCLNINYMPIKYQIMALMSKRKISVPVYLSVGNSMLAKVESYETFTDIKMRIMEEFGIDTKRLLPSYFSFFEIINFDNEQLEESPIQESQIVWDTITYWQKAKDKYKQSGIIPPSFFLMLKIKYAYECHFDDEESIQLMFHQTYFDYFIGRIRLPVEKLGALAACVKFLKFMDQPKDDIKGCFPSWVLKSTEENILRKAMVSNLQSIKLQNFSPIQVKFRFLSIAQQCPLCMSLAVGTEQNLKLFMKQKNIFLAQKYEIVESIAVKQITKYAEDEEKFIFSIRGVQQTKIIYTQYASICCSFLSVLPDLVKRRNQDGSNKILNF